MLALQRDDSNSDEQMEDGGLESRICKIGPERTIARKHENLVADQVNQAIAENKNVKVEVLFLPPIKWIIAKMKTCESAQNKGGKNCGPVQGDKIATKTLPHGLTHAARATTAHVGTFWHSKIRSAPIQVNAWRIRRPVPPAYR
jgi:hypothetical protein